jgi:hypothetical protein
MRPRSSFAFFLVFVALIIAGSTALALQWRESMELRVTLERAKIDANEVARLTDDNKRLRAQQIPPAELERLRSDHAALPRLRAELEALQRPPSAAK